MTQNIKNPKLSLRRFLNYCDVEYSEGVEYDIVSKIDNEVFIRVSVIEDVYTIVENEHFTVDTESKMEDVFNVVTEHIKSEGVAELGWDRECEDDYEHPSVAGGYSQSVRYSY